MRKGERDKKMVRDWTKEYFDIEERPEVGEKNLNLILQKPDNVANNVAKPTLQHLEAKNDKIELLKSALKYSNSTAQLALILIRSIDSLNKSAIARDLEEMITKIKIVLNDESEK